MMKFKASFISLLTILGMTDWASKLEASSSEDVNLTADDVNKIKAEVEGFKSAKETAEKALADLKAEKATVDTSLAEATKAKEASEKTVADNTKIIEELNAKVEKLGKLPGADALDPNANSEDTDEDWRSEEVKNAAHNQSIFG